MLTLGYTDCDVCRMLSPTVSHRSSYLAPLAWSIRDGASWKDTTPSRLDLTILSRVESIFLDANRALNILQ
jgi:hypothetical protein